MVAYLPFLPALSHFRLSGALNREALEVTARSHSCRESGSRPRTPPTCPEFDLGRYCWWWLLTSPGIPSGCQKVNEMWIGLLEQQLPSVASHPAG